MVCAVDDDWPLQRARHGLSALDALLNETFAFRYVQTWRRTAFSNMGANTSSRARGFRRRPLADHQQVFGIGWWHLAHVVTDRNERPGYIVRSHTGFDTDQTPRHICGTDPDPTTSKLLTQNNRAKVKKESPDRSPLAERGQRDQLRKSSVCLCRRIKKIVRRNVR
jgi:hypothetical protein